MPFVPQTHTRHVSAEISASRLRANYTALRHAAGTAMDVLAVVKADAYGHGAAQCAPVLAAAGGEWLGVASVEEGASVRSALGILPQGMVPRVLVMCALWPGEQAACLDRGLTPVVWEPYHLDLLEAEARRRGLPARSLPVHVEIDTGMARQGVAPGPLLHQLLARFAPGSPLLLEGVLTHLASSECTGSPQNAHQMVAFAAALEQVRQAGLRPLIVHAGNTSSLDSGFVPRELPALAYRMGAKAMTRAGLALYGYALPLEGSSPGVAESLKHVMRWTARVAALREIQSGDTVGYNATFTAPHAMRLALLPVGYADGFRRALSSRDSHAAGAVLLHGSRAPIVGRVSMNLSVVDVTAIPDVQTGDEAVLLGEQGTRCITAEEHARLADTSVYEILCGIHSRVPRVVVD